MKFIPANLKTKWARLIAAAILLLIALGLFHKEIRFLFTQDPMVVLEVTERFNDGFSQHPEAIENHGFAPGPKGWYLPPGSEATLRYTAPITLTSEGVTLLFPVFYRPPQGANALRVSWDGGKTFSVITEDISLLGSRIELVPPPQGGTPELRFEATNKTASPVLVLDRLDLRLFERRPTPPPSPLRMTLAFIGFGLPVILLAGNTRRSFLLLGILALGFLPRYLNFLRVLYAPLDPDAQGYKLYAEQMTLFGENGFYSANFSIREPFFLLVAKTFFEIFGTSDTHLRFVSLFFSVAAIALTYQLSRELFGYRLGLLGALAVAVNIPLIIESGRGLRLEFEMVLLLLFSHVAFVKRGVAPLPRFLVLGALGGLIVLARSAYLPGLALLIFASAATHERPLKRIIQRSGLAILLMVALLAPHQYMIYKRHGDFFWDANTMTRWFANMEFGGQPGFPSWEELEKNSFAGPRITYAEYLFRLHTPGEVLTGVGRGLLKIIGNMDVVGYRRPVAAILGFDAGWIDHVVTSLGGLGLLLALLAPGFRWFPLAFLALTLHVAFLYDRGLIEPYRLTMHAFPFFLLCGLLTLQEALAWASARASKGPLALGQEEAKDGDLQAHINRSARL